MIYRGPWRQVEDDDGHVFRRGERIAVCAKTFALLGAEPYADQVIGVEPRAAIPREQRELFDCDRSARRHPRETKGEGYTATREGAVACGPGFDCA